MRTRGLWRSTFVLLTLALGAAGVVGACSLGLDPNKIPGGDSGSDASLDGFIDAPNPVQCKTDPDCKPTNGCLTGKCNAGQCNYTLCATNACNASVCDGTSHTCSAPAAYSFHASQFHVSLGNIGCGGGAGVRRCFAAVYPFVFVGTTNGVVAYAVANPTNGTPSSIPVAGLPFFPNFIVSNGQVVYFVGSVAGTGPTYKVPIATLTVPTDPTVTEMVASTVFDTLQVTSVDAVFPDIAGGIYLVREDPTKVFPAARIAAPLNDLDTLSFSPTAGASAIASVAAASGTRLVTFRQENGAPFDSFFSLETAAATGSAQNAGEQSLLASMGQNYANSYLAQGPKGGLLWTTLNVNVPDGGPATTVSARLAWVLADGTATSFDGTTHVDVATYNLAGIPNADLPGPSAWVDDNNAIVISAVVGNTAQSLVQMATRSGTPGLVPNRSWQLGFDPGSLAVAASNGFGYVLTPDLTAGANVHVFGTTCNN